MHTSRTPDLRLGQNAAWRPTKPHLRTIDRVLNDTRDPSLYLRLNQNEQVVPIPGRVVRRMRDAITADTLSAYPGLASIRTALARWVGCEAECLYLTAGSDAAIRTVFDVLVRPRDVVATLDPTYAMYSVYARLFRARLVRIACRPDLTFSERAILRTLTASRPRLICLANPNNPTGSVVSPSSLERIIRIALRQRTVVLVDEAYHPYHPETVVGLVGRYPNLIVTRSLSKAFPLAGGRIGCAVSNRDMIAAMETVRPLYEISGISAACAEVLLAHRATCRRAVTAALRGRSYLEHRLRRMRIPFFASHANFVVIDLGSSDACARVSAGMEQRGILIAGPFTHPRMRTCIRVTAGSATQMRACVNALKDVLRG
jgi:histidinol-phosphate aminotransferase